MRRYGHASHAAGFGHAVLLALEVLAPRSRLCAVGQELIPPKQDGGAAAPLSKIDNTFCPRTHSLLREDVTYFGCRLLNKA